MAIDLPPAMPPQLTPIQDVARESENYAPYTAKIGQFELRLSGEHGLTAEELKAVFESARTPSQVILLANAATYRKGHLLVRFLYTSPIDGVIHIHAIQHKLGQVQSSRAIQRYFSDMEGDRDLTRAEFQSAAVLASLYSDRIGVDYSISFEHNLRNNAIDLVFNEKLDLAHRATRFQAQLGNQGSRFAGRYFFNLGATHYFGTGTELSGGYETAITEWGEARDGKDFHRFQIKVDHPFTVGLYGVQASHTEYTREASNGAPTASSSCLLLPLLCVPDDATTTNPASAFDADIQQVAVTGNQIILSDIDRRLNLTQRLEWTDSTLDATNALTLQDERYAAAELGASYFKATRIGDRLLNWKLGLSAKGGLSGDSGTLGTDNGTEGISIGKRTAEFVVLNPSAAISYSLTDSLRATLTLNAQITNDQLPQQQQWVLGGIDRLSAYLPGVLVGDSGFHIDTGLSRRWTLGVFTLDVGLFAEYGGARYENASGLNSTGTVDYSQTASIADTGLRATIQAWDWFSLRAVVAESLSEDNLDEEVLQRSESDFFIVVKARI